MTKIIETVWIPMPDGIRTCDNEMGLVKHVAMKAGDVVRSVIAFD